MANPFQEKFLKAGLVNRKQVKKAELEQHKKQKEQRRQPGADPVAQAAEQALQRQKEQSRQSNAQRDQAAREKEAAAQIRQLAASNRIKVERGEIAFHFADAGKIKKMSLPGAIVEQLSKGSLGIVKIDRQYEIVPAETAGRIRDRNPAALLVLNERREPDPNDPYAEFPIPDDYEW
jgi:hypothetical protein